MSEPAYRVRLETFEGPLDLLLHLVKTNELDLYNLPIATITDQYLQYLDMFEELNLDVAGEYLVMAATLMYLKSRLLLPVDEEADEDGEEDPAVDLVRQLAEYQRYREAAEELRDRVLLHRDVFRRSPATPQDGDREDAGFHPVSLPDLLEALRRVLAAAAARTPHVLEGEEYSVADAVREMVARLRGAARIAFSELFEPGSPRGRIIASFVGLLEMIKLGILEAEQQGRGPIFLRLLDDPGLDEAISVLTETYSGQQRDGMDSADGMARNERPGSAAR